MYLRGLCSSNILSAEPCNLTIPHSPSMLPLKVGILLLGGAVQFLDTAVVDLFGMSTKAFLKPLSDQAIIPQNITDKGTDMQFLYISEQGANSTSLLTAVGGLHITVRILDSSHALD